MSKTINTIFTSLLLLLAVLANNSYAGVKVTYFHHDNLGSIVAASDGDSGALKWREQYQPYGERLLKEGDSENSIWFTGKTEEIGLNYFGARWYDPELGRFLANDPVGFKENNPMSFNRYAYANNNPYKFIDPDGRESYLVSRPLDFTNKANHNFIVSNANFLGDPKATVASFGDAGNDTMGRVDKNTKGFSKGTNNTDSIAWQSLSGGGGAVSYRKINAKDSIVDSLVSSVDKGLEYSLVPEIQGGVNSNTGAGAVAKAADGGSPRVKNGIKQTGTSNRVISRIKFNGTQPKKP